MRTINAQALAYVTKQYGSEPANVIRFEFGTYCDKDTSQALGKILNIDTIDGIVNISDNGSASVVTVQLDDTDGSIKEYMKTHDIHLTDATVYQWFDGLDFDDRFTLFNGKVNTPIAWDEGERTVTLTVISQLEDVEIGFSPEEGQFDNLGYAYIGKPWPLVFGEVAQVSAMQLNIKLSGATADGFGMVDSGLVEQVRISAAIRSTGNYNASDQSTWTPEMCLAKELEEQYATVKPGINIFNGESFPAGEIWLDFGRCIVKGYFTGHYFTFTSEPQFNPRSGSTVGFCDKADGDKVCGSAYSLYKDGQTGQTGLTKEEICNGMSAMAAAQAKIKRCGFMYVPPGTAVSLYDPEAIYYAVSCVPGTIKGVASYISTQGKTFLQDVDSSLWSQENWDLGNGQTGVILKINNALSKQVNPLVGVSWSDQVYVHFESTVGPNTARIIDYLIEHYSDKTLASYGSVETALDHYPSDFAIYSRPNLIDALQDIAWQARCSIILKDDTFHLTYLPAVQPSRDTITTSDILEDTLSIEYTDTEDVVTKMRCLWEATGTQQNPNALILRNNINKYGTKSASYDFFIYNYIDAVLKSGTFWLTRYSNTWKRVRFSTPISKLALETMDYVTLNLDDLSTDPVLALIEEVKYDSENHSLAFTCYAPVKAGTMVEYAYAYPQNLSASVTYPDIGAYNEWLASDAINKLTSGDMNEMRLQHLGRAPIVPGDNVYRTTPDPYNNTSGETLYTAYNFSDIDRRETDRGIRYISDLGDRHPGTLVVSSTPVMSQPDEVY